MKDGIQVASYWKTTEGVFDKVVKFKEVNDSGITIYAIFKKPFSDVSGFSGLSYKSGALRNNCFSFKENGEIALYLSNSLQSQITSLNSSSIEKKWTTNTKYNSYIEEMYIPNIETYYPNGLVCERVFMKKAEVRVWFNDPVDSTKNLRISLNLHKYYLNNEQDGSWEYYFNSNAIEPIYRQKENGTLERIGYIKLKFDGIDYAKSGTSNSLNFALVKDINNSPKIKAMLNDPRQIVLLGDSHFGYPAPNLYAGIIQGITGIKTFNLGFGGCRMAWRTADGSDNFDVYTFPNIVDALISRDFSTQEAQISIGMGYARQVADLEAIDTTKPFQILLHFGANDCTGGTLLGDIWTNDPTWDMSDESIVNSKLSSLNRSYYNEAFNYGLIKLYYNFTTLVNIQALDEGWRWYEDENGKRCLPWSYTNSIGLKVIDYINALKDNCHQSGVRYVEYINCGIMNAFSMIPTPQTESKTGLGIQGSAHLEAIGFAQVAQYFANVAKFYYAY